jgi:hypothetical protein
VLKDWRKFPKKLALWLLGVLLALLLAALFVAVEIYFHLVYLVLKT